MTTIPKNAGGGGTIHIKCVYTWYTHVKKESLKRVSRILCHIWLSLDHRVDAHHYPFQTRCQLHTGAIECLVLLEASRFGYLLSHLWGSCKTSGGCQIWIPPANLWVLSSMEWNEKSRQKAAMGIHEGWRQKAAIGTNDLKVKYAEGVDDTNLARTHKCYSTMSNWKSAYIRAMLLDLTYPTFNW